jgi:hypothetical protein
MPDQPADPIRYEMKIPPEAKDATLNQQDTQKGSDEETKKPNRQESKHDKIPSQNREKSKQG